MNARLRRWSAGLACLAALAAPAIQAAPVRVGPVEASLLLPTRGVERGKPFDVGLLLRMDPGWHTYGRDPGDAGQPTEIAWELPPGFSAGPLQWPSDETFTLGSVVSRGYKDEVLLITTITPPAHAVPEPLVLRAEASWIACSDQCMPGSAHLELAVPVSASPVAAEPATAVLFAQARATLAGPAEARPNAAPATLLGTLLTAMLGGLFLNLMPCVFPVIGIKIMGFVHQSGADRRRVSMHGLVFAAGVLVSFWGLAGLLLILRAGGEQVGWGFQLQSPAFVFALAAFFLAFGLSMSGVFEFGLAATRIGSSLQAKSGYTGSFFTGVLVTVVSTPCAAPFLAPALGAAFTLPPAHSLLLFTAMALGLSVPYLVLSAFPRLVKLLPRPGAWMEALRQLMAFPLYGTVAFLVWVLAGQLEESAFLNALAGLVAVAMAAWVYGRWTQRDPSPLTRRLGLGVVLALAIGAALLGLPRDRSATTVTWRAWSPELVERLRGEGRVVYVDFTARWCATCKVNKVAVFGSDDVVEAFATRGVIALRADWTSRDPAITAALAEFGRSAVPFNLVYGPGAPEPVQLPEVLTPRIVLDALDRADRALVAGAAAPTR